MVAGGWPVGEGTSASFADRFDALAAAMHPHDRGPYTNDEIADGIRSVGGPSLSSPYIQQLRKGRRDKPSLDLVLGIARFFGVPIGYFAGETDTALAPDEVVLLNVVRSPDLREMVGQLDELDSHTRQIVAELVAGLVARNPPERG